MMPRSAPMAARSRPLTATGMCRVYDLATLKTVMTLDAGEANASSVAFSPDGKQIVAGYYKREGARLGRLHRAPADAARRQRQRRRRGAVQRRRQRSRDGQR